VRLAGRDESLLIEARFTPEQEEEALQHDGPLVYALSSLARFRVRLSNDARRFLVIFLRHRFLPFQRLKPGVTLARDLPGESVRRSVQRLGSTDNA